MNDLGLMVFDKKGTKLTLHNEAAAPFEYLGLVDSFDGYDILQTRNYIKLSAKSYIQRLLKGHGWDKPSPRESSNKPKPPLHESDVANLFNLAAGLVENTPEHKALEVEQSFGYRSILGEILFTYVLCHPDIGYAVTTLAKFSTVQHLMLYATNPSSIWQSISARLKTGALCIGVRNLSIHFPRCRIIL